MTNVIDLSKRFNFRPAEDKTEDTELYRSLISCRICHNKTYTLEHVSEESFPVCKCAACGAHISYVGFIPPEDKDES